MAVTRRIFDAEKRYEFGKMQHLKELFHWDVNETQDENLYRISRILQSAIGDNVLIEDALFLGGVSFELEAPAPPVSIGYRPGIAIINGRWCDAGNGLAIVDYDDDANIIAKCVVRNIIEDTPGSQYTIEMYGNAGFEDFVSALQDQISGANIRIQFTSGVEDGNTFEVGFTTPSTDTTFTIADDLSGVVDGDTFVVRPPAITANLSSQVDEIYLCNLYQELDENCDSDLEDPTLSVTPTKRFASRTFITLNPDHGALTGDALTGVVCMKLGEFERLTPGADILPVRTAVWVSPSTSMINYAVEGIEALLLEKDFQDSAQNPIIVSAELGGTTVTLSDAKHITHLNGSSGLWVENLEELVVTLTNTDNDNVVVVAGTGNYIDATQTPATTTQLSLQDQYVVKAAVSAHDTLGTQIVLDAFEMGHADFYRGFNYHVGDYTGSNANITISPGETFRRGKMFQSPRELTISANTAGNWIEGSAQTDWCYIYMREIGRTCSPFLSASRPTINGMFGDITTLETAYSVTTAFCIGMFYRGASNIIPCTCKNSVIHFTTELTGASPAVQYELVTGMTVSATSAAGNRFSSALLPVGPYEIQLCIDATSCACTSTGYFKITCNNEAADKAQVQKIVHVPTTAAPITHYLDFPMDAGTYSFLAMGTTLDWTLTGCNVILSKLKFNPLFFTPAAKTWII